MSRPPVNEGVGTFPLSYSIRTVVILRQWGTVYDMPLLPLPFPTVAGGRERARGRRGMVWDV
jgi:hypothetical protein